MKCAQCVAEGKKSTVHPEGTFITAMASEIFYDEDGERHHHDMNVRSGHFLCSNGHKWVHRTQGRCPAPNCPWNKVVMDEIVSVAK